MGTQLTNHAVMPPISDHAQGPLTHDEPSTVPHAAPVSRIELKQSISVTLHWGHVSRPFRGFESGPRSSLGVCIARNVIVGCGRHLYSSHLSDVVVVGSDVGVVDSNSNSPPPPPPPPERITVVGPPKPPPPPPPPDIVVICPPGPSLPPPKDNAGVDLPSYFGVVGR